MASEISRKTPLGSNDLSPEELDRVAGGGLGENPSRAHCCSLARTIVAPQLTLGADREATALKAHFASSDQVPSRAGTEVDLEPATLENVSGGTDLLAIYAFKDNKIKGNGEIGDRAHAFLMQQVAPPSGAQKQTPPEYHLLPKRGDPAPLIYDKAAEIRQRLDHGQPPSPFPPSYRR